MALTAVIKTPSITFEQPVGLFIDGMWVKGTQGQMFKTINPSNEEPITAVYEATPEGIRHASDAQFPRSSDTDSSQMSMQL